MNRKSSILAIDSPRQSRAPLPKGIRARVEPPPPSRKRSERRRSCFNWDQVWKNAHQITESNTWFEAVRVSPNCRIMVSSKQIRDDDSVLGDEVTRDTKRFEGLSQWKEMKTVLACMMMTTRKALASFCFVQLTCCLWWLCVALPAGRPAWVAAPHSQESSGQEVCVCRCTLGTAPPVRCTAPHTPWSAPED